MYYIFASGVVKKVLLPVTGKAAQCALMALDKRDSAFTTLLLSIYWHGVQNTRPYRKITLEISYTECDCHFVVLRMAMPISLGNA